MHWAVLLDFNTIAPVTFKLPNIITLTRHSNISCQEMLFRGSGLNAMIAVRHDFLWLSVHSFNGSIFMVDVTEDVVNEAWRHNYTLGMKGEVRRIQVEYRGEQS